MKRRRISSLLLVAIMIVENLALSLTFNGEVVFNTALALEQTNIVKSESGDTTLEAEWNSDKTGGSFILTETIRQDETISDKLVLRFDLAPGVNVSTDDLVLEYKSIGTEWTALGEAATSSIEASRLTITINEPGGSLPSGSLIRAISPWTTDGVFEEGMIFNETAIETFAGDVSLSQKHINSPLLSTGELVDYSIETYLLDSKTAHYRLKSKEQGKAPSDAAYDISAPDRAGYVLDYSKSVLHNTISSDGSTVFSLYYKPITYVTINYSDVTIKRLGEDIGYNVTYDMGSTEATGTLPATYTSKAGTENTVVTNPSITWKNHKFLGWKGIYIDGSETKEITISDDKFVMPASDVTLKAQWEHIKVHYTFSVADSYMSNISGSMPDIEVDEGEKIPLTRRFTSNIQTLKYAELRVHQDSKPETEFITDGIMPNDNVTVTYVFRSQYITKIHFHDTKFAIEYDYSLTNSKGEYIGSTLSSARRISVGEDVVIETEKNIYYRITDSVPSGQAYYLIGKFYDGNIDSEVPRFVKAVRFNSANDSWAGGRWVFSWQADNTNATYKPIEGFGTNLSSLTNRVSYYIDMTADIVPCTTVKIKTRNSLDSSKIPCTFNATELEANKYSGPRKVEIRRIEKNFEFVHWEDKDGNVVTTDLNLDLNLYADKYTDADGNWQSGLEFYAYFNKTPENMQYKVEHYLTGTDKTYSGIYKYATEKFEALEGTAVDYDPVPSTILTTGFPGFEPDLSNPDNVIHTDKLKENTVFKLYYKPIKVKINYDINSDKATGDLSSLSTELPYYTTFEWDATQQVVRKVDGRSRLERTELMSLASLDTLNKLVSWTGHKITGLEVKDADGNDLELEDISSGYEYGVNDYLVPNKDVTIKLLWESIGYNVTYDMGSTEVTGTLPASYISKTGTENTVVTNPSITWKNHKFLGWKGIYIDGSETKEITISDDKFVMPASDVTLKAQWEHIKVHYTISVADSYKSNISGSMPDIEVDEGEKIPLTRGFTSSLQTLKYVELRVHQDSKPETEFITDGIMPNDNVTVTYVFRLQDITKIHFHDTQFEIMYDGSSTNNNGEYIESSFSTSNRITVGEDVVKEIDSNIFYRTTVSVPSGKAYYLIGKFYDGNIDSEGPTFEKAVRFNSANGSWAGGRWVFSWQADRTNSIYKPIDGFGTNLSSRINKVSYNIDMTTDIIPCTTIKIKTRNSLDSSIIPCTFNETDLEADKYTGPQKVEIRSIEKNFEFVHWEDKDGNVVTTDSDLDLNLYADKYTDEEGNWQSGLEFYAYFNKTPEKIPYKVEHYLTGTDETYSGIYKAATLELEALEGTAVDYDPVSSSILITAFPGFEPDLSNPNNVIHTDKLNDRTVFKLYYKPIKVKIDYDINSDKATGDLSSLSTELPYYTTFEWDATKQTVRQVDSKDRLERTELMSLASLDTLNKLASWTGHKIIGLEVKDADGNDLELEDTSSGYEYGVNDYLVPNKDVTIKLLWEDIDYSITYSKGWGVVLGTLPDNRTDAHYNEKITLGDSSKLTRIGYTFKEWEVKDADSNTVTVTDNKFTMPLSNVTVTALWTANDYKVTYVDDAAAKAEGTMPTALTGKHYEDEISLEKTPSITRNGHIFSGWNVTYTEGGTSKSVTVTDYKFSLPAFDVTATAIWTPLDKISYSVEYYLEKLDDKDSYDMYSEVDTDEVVPDTEINLSRDFAGFTFDSGVAGCDYHDDMFEADEHGHVFKLYYKRNRNYKVSYDKGMDSADGTMDGLTDVAYEQEVTFAERKYTNKGYKFIGWKINKTGTSEELAYTGTSFKMPAYDVTITAQWEPKDKLRYTVVHKIQKLGSSEYEAYGEPIDGEVDFNGAVNIDPISIYGFTFNSAKSIYSDDMFEPSEDEFVFELYYERISDYTVSYALGSDKATGTLPTSLTGKSFEEQVTLEDKPDIERNGYTFGGWRITYMAGSSETEVSVSSFKFSMPAGDATATAIWVPLDKIKYSAKHFKQKLDGSYDETSPDALDTDIVVDTNSEVIVSSKDFEGFVFDSSAAGTDYTDDKYEADENGHVFKLYYKRINNYTVKFSGGLTTATGSMDSIHNLMFEQEVTIPDNLFVNPGYTFKGWKAFNDTTSDEISITSNVFTMPASDVTVVAQWTTGEASYTIEYYFQKLGSSEYDDPVISEPVKVATESKVEIKEEFEGFVLNTTTSDYKMDKFIYDGYVFKLYYDRIRTFKATYDAGATDAVGTIPTVNDLEFGQTVTIADFIYTRPGWVDDGFKVTRNDTSAEIDIIDGKITMPASDVTITALWIHATLSYKVEHYQMDLDRTNYTLVKTDGPISVAAKSKVDIMPYEYPGFTFDASKSDYKMDKIVVEDHVFKLYYTRISNYKVTYAPGCLNYKGSMPELSDRQFGETVVLAANAYIRYSAEFKGWQAVSVKDGKKIEITDNKIVMPANDVLIIATWEAPLIGYKVEHYQLGLDKKTYELVETKEYSVAIESTVSFEPNTYSGFTYNTSKSENYKANLTTDGYVFKMYYDRISNYKLSYDKGADDVTGSMTNLDNCQYGETITLARNNYKRSGYGFAGFSVKKVSSGETVPLSGNQITMPADDVLLTALWESGKISYDVEYYQLKLGAQAGNTANYDLIETDIGNTTVSGSRVEISPKSYAGFKLNNDLSKTVDDSLTTDGYVFKVYYDRLKNFKAVYDGGSEDVVGVISPVKNLLYGQTFTIATNTFTRDGYVFKDWMVTNDSDKSKVKITSGKFEMPASDVTITATWVKADAVSYTVEHWTMDLDRINYTLRSTDAVMTVSANSNVEIAPKDISGFTFDSSRSDYKDSRFIDDGHVFKLYYSRNNDYTVHFNKGIASATGSISDATLIPYEYMFVLPDSEYIHPSYTFKEWRVTKDSDGSELAVTGGRFKMPACDVTATAVWDGPQIKYTAWHFKQQLDGSYDELSPDDEDLWVSVTASAPVRIVAKDYDGFELDTAKSDYKSSALTEDGHVFRLYYKRISTYKVTYSSGCTKYTGTMANLTNQKFGDTITIAENQFKRSGMDFNAWTVTADKDGSTVPITGGKFTMPASDVTITAKWLGSKITYTAEHYQMNLDRSTWTLVKTDAPVAVISGEKVEIPRETYAGFSFQPSKSDYIDEEFTDDGHVFKLYYMRNTSYKIKYLPGCDDYTGDMTIREGIQFGASVFLDECGYHRDGYAFAGWDVKADKSSVTVTLDGMKLEMPASSITATALWESGKINYSVEYYQLKLGAAADTASNYVLVDTDMSKVCDSGTRVEITPRDYDGFRINTKLSTTINDSLTTDGYVFKIYYDRLSIYKAVYDGGADDAVGVMSPITKLSIGQTVTIETNTFTRDCYVFKNWTVSNNKDGSEIEIKSGKFVMPASDVTITANWLPNKISYTVEHYKQNLDLISYSKADTDDKIIVAALSAVEISPKNYAGYEFKSDKSDYLAAKLDEENHVFKLYYDLARNIKITFNPGCLVYTGSMSSYTDRMVGETFTIPENQYVRDGFTFKGWQVSKDCDGSLVAVSSGKFTIPESDVTVTALWDGPQIKYTAWHFKQQLDGSYDEASPDDEDLWVSVTASAPVRIVAKDYDGFELDTAKSDCKSSALTEDGHVFRLYYKRISTYKVTYSSGCTKYTGTMANLTNQKFGDTITIAENQFKRSGMDFNGWTLTADKDGSTVPVTACTFTMPASDVTITAKWLGSKITYTAEHYQMNLDRSTWTLVKTDAPVAVISGGKVEIPRETYAGFSFQASKSDYIDEEFTDDGHIFKLYYMRNTSYKIKYLPGCDDYTGDMTNREGIQFGASVFLDDCGYHRDGYTFAGWDVKAEKTTSAVTLDGARFEMPASNVVATALWEAGKISYTVQHYQLKPGAAPGTAGNYTLVDKDMPMTCNLGDPVTVSPKTYAGFTLNTKLSTTSITGLTIDNYLFKIYYDQTKDFKLSYDSGAADATGDMAGKSGLSVGQTINIDSNAFTRSGYVFTKWTVTNDTDKSEIKVSSGKFVMPASDVTITANWAASKISYTAEHYQQNADLVSYTKADTDDTVSVSPKNAVQISKKKYAGYEFDASKSDYKSSSFTDDGHVFKLYYKRVHNIHITFNAGCVHYTGTMLGFEYRMFGETFTIPDNEYVRTGFTFIGWKVTKDSDGSEITVSANSFTVPESDVTVTALWDGPKYKYSVEHYQQNIDGSYDTPFETEPEIELTEEEAVKITPKDYEGFTFNKTKSDYETSALTEDGHVFKLYYERHGGYKVTYKPGCDTYSGSMTNLTGRKYGEIIELASNVYKRSGYGFTEWTVAMEDGTPVAVTDKQFTMPDGNVIVTANWELGKIAYYVEHYQMNLDRKNYTKIETETPKAVYTGSRVEITPKDYEGFTFNPGKGKFIDESLSTENYIFKLYYTRNTGFTVSYDSGDPAATGSIKGMTGRQYGETITIAKNSYIRTDLGYTFDKWIVSTEGGSEVKVSSSKFKMPNSNVIITATWKETPIPYTVVHYIKKTDGSGYEKFKTEKFTATKGTTVTATPLVDDGLIYTPDAPDEVLTDTVSNDRTTTLKLYYDRKKFKIYYAKGSTKAKGDMGYTEAYYLETVNVTQCGFELEEYFVNGWHITKYEGPSLTTKAASYRFGEIADTSLAYSIDELDSKGLGATMDIVIGPTGSFKMPAYDITATVVWAAKVDTHGVTGVGTVRSCGIDTGEHENFDCYLILLIISLLLAADMYSRRRNNNQ